jgi:hypothetical protein
MMNASYYWDRAQDARERAATTADSAAKESWLRLAQEYDTLAQVAASREIIPR